MASRKVIVMLLSFMLLFGTLMGCNNDKTASPDADKSDVNGKSENVDESKKPKEKVKIVAWNDQRHNKEVREALVKKYNETNKDNIEIEYRVFTDNYSDQLKLANNAGTLPDIIFNPADDVVNAEVLLPIKDILTDEEKRFVPAAFEKGEISKYLISESVTSFKMVYNKDLFKEAVLDPGKPPKTWEEMREYAKQITAQGEGKKYGLGLPIKTPAAWIWYGITPSARSGDMMGDQAWNAKEGKYEFEKFGKYIQFWIDVNKDGSLFPGVGTYDNDMIRAQFAEGNVGMLTAAAWDVGVYNDQFPAKIDWGVFEFPTWDGKVYGGEHFVVKSGAAINKNSPHLDEAIKVWKFFTSDEVYITEVKAGLGNFTNIASQDPAIQPEGRKGLAGFNIKQPAVAYPAQPLLDYKLINPPMKVGKIDVASPKDRWAVFTEIFMTDGKDMDKKLKELSDIHNKLLEEGIKAGKIDPDQMKDPNFSPLPKQ
jgi:multiple sugar transport system substrate-binding protein